jgi:hypothetical protein
MGRLLNTSSVMMCPHLGTVSVTSLNFRARASGSYLVRPSDTFVITGCTYSPGSPHPCVTVQWTTTDQSSSADGDSTLSDSCEGMCLAADQAPQGTVQIVFTQQPVSGQ